MRRLFHLALAIVLAVPLAAMPTVDESIPKCVSDLGPPTTVDFKGGLRMAVSASDEEVQKEVIQGLDHLTFGWDFEAARHFAVAMRKDPDCLLAHWGMVMALLVPAPETGAARNAAAERMLELLDDPKNGTALERGYVYGLVKYLSDGAAAASTAFRKVATDFPNDLLAPLYAAMFGRTGYDETGDATPDQEWAEKTVAGLVEKHADNLLPCYALLMMRAEGPDPAQMLEPARKLVAGLPGYAPFHHMLGHFQWRCGRHQEAAASFGRATSLYSAWMRSNKATAMDCPPWTISECYRIVALASAGDFETATSAAQSLAKIPVSLDRSVSDGGRTQLWEGWTLPARLFMARGEKGDAAKALASLPAAEALKPYDSGCMASWWIDSLRLALESQVRIEAGNAGDARKYLDTLAIHRDKMVDATPRAAIQGERSSWSRGFDATEILLCETRGKVALIGPEEIRAAATTWFSSAANRQRLAPLMMPPMVLTPEYALLGEVQLKLGEPGKAAGAFEKALERFPENYMALDGLRRSYVALKRPADAGKVEARIKAMQTP